MAVPAYVVVAGALATLEVDTRVGLEGRGLDECIAGVALDAASALEQWAFLALLQLVVVAAHLHVFGL